MPPARPRPPAAVPRLLRAHPRRRVLSAGTALATTLGVLLCGAPSASAATPIHLGAVGQVAELSRQIGAPLAVHSYSWFHKPVPEGRMISVRAEAPWREVAAAGPGSPLHADMVRWARTLRDRPGPVLVAYHHEPEARASSGYGDADQFVAAFRRVVDVFRAEGVTNVRFTWQMTASAFTAPPGDRRSAAAWYPGDAWVDDVGADAYNWAECGEGRGRWVELSTLIDPVLAFARAHGKQASLPEFGADPDPRRGQWLANAHAYLVANRDVVSAAFYFNRGPTNPANQDCSWTLTQRAEFDAYGAMARDLTHFTA
ncbi:glycosyl hydrolase [Geodermatophilus sp. URMC 61]|uniref:glycosyl hydrolase n=1 Tax=Geodermatophilus sp. URMC 61 TaxID=3423411 RepID=UPI00406D22DE